MKDLLNSMKVMREQPTVLEASPGNDPQAHGMAEKAVQDGLAQVRTIKVGLEYRLKAKVPEDHPVFEWMCEHAGWLLNRPRVGRDGLTAWQRVTGKPCKQSLVELGEIVYAKPLRISAGNRERANLEARWYRGVWLGVHDRTGERIVASLNGGQANLVRTIKRLTGPSDGASRLWTRFEQGPGNPIPEAEQIIDRPKKLNGRRQEPELDLALIPLGCHPAGSCQVKLQTDAISGLQSG